MNVSHAAYRAELLTRTSHVPLDVVATITIVVSFPYYPFFTTN